MSFFIEYIKCEIYQVVQIGKNPQRCFFQQQRMDVLLSRMPMSASTVAGLEDLLQSPFKNRGMMGEVFSLWTLSVIIKCACPDSQFFTSHLDLM